MSTPHWGMGVSGVATRNTEQDSRTQKLTGVVRPQLPEVSGALYGGDIPQSAETWSAFFKDKHANPYGVLGNKPGISQTPNVRLVVAGVSDPQNLVSGGGHDLWRGFFDTVMGSMRNGSGSGTSVVR